MAETLLFEERTLEGFSDTGSGYWIYAEQLTFPAFVAGETYRVLWDGTEYSCLAGTFEGSVFIGNMNIVGLDYGNGEPFLMGVGNQDGQETFMCATTQEEPSHTVSIYRKEKELPSADIKIKGYSGIEFTYEKVPKVYLAAPESTTDNPVLVPFTYGEAIEGVEVEPDFTDGDMQITAPDGYLIRSGVVKKPETLVPENIAKDVEVAGIVGTHEGASSDVDDSVVQYTKRKAINFYDILGNIVYSYTREEFSELTELPVGPEIDGYDFYRWSWTIDDIKNAYFADVGPFYNTKNGNNAALLVVDVDADVTVPVYFSLGYSGTVFIDWGDGTTSSKTLTNTSAKNNNTSLSHTYNISGRVIIGLWHDATIGSLYLGRYYQTASNSRYGVIGGTASGFNHRLIAVSCGMDANLGQSSLYNDYGLRFLCGSGDSYGYYTPYNCYALETFAYKEGDVTTGCFTGCYSLKRLASYGFVLNAAANNMYGMQDFWHGGSRLENGAALWARNLILTNASVVTPSGTLVADRIFKIYVPDELVDTYKTTSAWSKYAKNFRPISEYPDY